MNIGNSNNKNFQKRNLVAAVGLFGGGGGPLAAHSATFGTKKCGYKYDIFCQLLAA